MPINFDLLNTTGSGLPDFAGGVMQRLEKEKEQQRQAQLQSRQLNFQNNLALQQDARAAKLDEAKLAREQLGITLDSNVDNRAERRTNADIGYIDAQKSKLNSDIKLDWSKFGVDTDLSYQKLDLFTQNQKFTQGLAQKESDKSIQWGDNADNRAERKFLSDDNREDRKFNFEISKHNEKTTKDLEFRGLLQKARQQGTEEYTNALLDQGLVSEASTFQDVQKKLQEGRIAIEGEKNKKLNDAFFAQNATDVLSGTMRPENAKAYLGVMFGNEFTNKIPEQDIPKVATITFMNQNHAALANVVQDPKKLIAAKNGWAPPPDLSSELVKPRSDMLVTNNSQLQVNRQIKKNLELQATIADNYPMIAGNFDPKAMSIPFDVLASLEGVLAKGGYPGKKLRNADDVAEALQALQAATASMLASSNVGGSDKDGPARTMVFYRDSQNAGAPGIRAFAEGLGLDTLINNAYGLNALAEKHPNASPEKLMIQQTNMMNDLNAIEGKLGRRLKENELNEFYSGWGD